MHSLCSAECQYRGQNILCLTVYMLLIYEQDIFREIKIYSNVKFVVATELKCSSSLEKLSQFYKFYNQF
jgi:hypothetical protein